VVKLVAMLLAAVGGAVASAGLPVYEAEIVHTYPHDPKAYTEGLFYLDGYLYESTGLEQHSSIRKVEIATGKVLQRYELPPQYFGEGIAPWKGHLISLTWKSQLGFVFDLASFKLQRQFHYEGEGWALTQDGKQLIMSDGTPALRFLDPDSLRETHRLQVTMDGKALRNVNELEWVDGEIFANVWQTNWIVRIDPRSGHVVGLVNLSGLLAPADRVTDADAVLNGIAYDPKHGRLFVTGKYWPKLFEIRLRMGSAAAQEYGR